MTRTANMAIRGSYNGMDEFRNHAEGLRNAVSTLVPGWTLPKVVGYLRDYHKRSPYRLIKSVPGAAQTDVDWELWASPNTVNCVFAFIHGLQAYSENTSTINLYPNAVKGL